jgi:hypothetical protein
MLVSPPAPARLDDDGQREGLPERDAELQGAGSCTVDSWASMRSLAFEPRPPRKT